jgi:ABC-2 type transport system ATP-binding protein
VDTILRTEKITKFFGKNKVLDEVDMTVPKGSMYGFLGPNGAGKTTLIRILNRIFYADKGEVYWNDLKLKNVHTKKIGYLPEERGMYKKMSVFENMVFFGSIKDYPQKRLQSKRKSY